MAGDFSDEEWDLPDDQLDALEQNAIRSTQQPPQQQQHRYPHQHQPSTNTDGPSNRANGLNLANTQRLDTPALQRALAAARNGRHLRTDVGREGNDSPVLDEDGFPLVLEEEQPVVPPRRLDETAQREQWRLNRFAPQQSQPQPPYRPASRAIPRQAHQIYHQQPQPAASARSPVRQTIRDPDPTATSLQGDAALTELERLRKERDVLAQSLNDATTQLQTARGEIAVIRSKTANDIKSAERQMSVLKKQIQEESTKHQAALRSKDAAYDRLATEASFLKHEVSEQTRKIDALQRPAKDKPLQDRSHQINFSPRKGPISNINDGFNDDEVISFSPTKSPAKNRRSKPNTPTKKRKQPTSNVPDVPPLVLRLSGEQLPPQAAKSKDKPETQIVRDYRSQQNLKLLQDVLSFRPLERGKTILEILVLHAFPSDPARPLSSVLLAETSQLRGQRLPGDLLGVFIKLLERCRKEEHYKPLAVLLPTIKHILHLEPTVVDAELIQSIIPPLEAIAMINPRKRFVLADRNQIWDEKNPRPTISPDVNSTACLDLLCVIAGLVADEESLIDLFWQRLPYEVILLILTPRQQLADIELILELLATSIRKDSFGVLHSAPEDQALMETHILDKMAYLLWDPPKPIINSHPQPRRLRKQQTPPTPTSKSVSSGPSNLTPAPALVTDLPTPTRFEICQLRLKIISLFTHIIVTSQPHPHKAALPTHHGTNFVLSHPNAIARLVRCLYDEVSALYTSPPTLAPLHAQLVNRITYLLHHILTSPQATSASSKFDWTKALSGTLVGVHKFRVVMTRLAFRDDVDGGVASGVTEETMAMAEEILQEYVTPDEAVQILEAFGKGPGGDEAEAEAEAEADVEMEGAGGQGMAG